MYKKLQLWTIKRNVFLEKLSRSTFWVVRYCPRCFLSYFDTFLNLHQLVYPPSQLKAPLCSDVANVDFSIWKKKISQMQKMHFCRLWNIWSIFITLFNTSSTYLSPSKMTNISFKVSLEISQKKFGSKNHNSKYHRGFR